MCGPRHSQPPTTNTGGIARRVIMNMCEGSTFLLLLRSLASTTHHVRKASLSCSLNRNHRVSCSRFRPAAAPCFVPIAPPPAVPGSRARTAAAAALLLLLLLLPSCPICFPFILGQVPLIPVACAPLVALLLFIPLLFPVAVVCCLL